jgi:hypothetical protein
MTFASDGASRVPDANLLENNKFLDQAERPNPAETAVPAEFSHISREAGARALKCHGVRVRRGFNRREDR